MVVWLTPTNKAAFQAIYREEDIKPKINAIDVTNPNIEDIGYLLGYYQIKDEKLNLRSNPDETIEKALTDLLNYKLHNDDTESRDRVFSFIISLLEGRGIVLDLNCMIDDDHITEVITQADKIKVVGGLLALPSTITSIDTGSYEGDEELKQIRRCDSLVAIHSRAFKNAKNLEVVQFNHLLSYIGEQAFYSTAIKSIKLGKGTRVLGRECFAYNAELQELELNEGIESIGYGAFMQCSNLTTVVLPSTCTMIGANAFAMCSLVTDYDLGQVEDIGDFCFYGNRSLTSLQLPSTVKRLGKHVFDGCDSLKSLHLPGSLSLYGDDTFAGLPKDCKVYVDKEHGRDAPILLALTVNHIPYEVNEYA